MFQSPSGEITLSTSFELPSHQPDKLCHILLGSHTAVIAAINRMSTLGYCDRIAWSDPIPTGRSGEYISLMSRRISPTMG